MPPVVVAESHARPGRHTLGAVVVDVWTPVARRISDRAQATPTPGALLLRLAGVEVVAGLAKHPI